MSYTQSELSGQEPLKSKIKEHEQNLENWEDFLSLIESESDETIAENAEELNLVHYDSNLNYSFDYDTLSPEKKLVAKRNELIRDFTYHIPNLVLKKGKVEIKKEIDKNIANEKLVIESLNATLKNSKK